jgi:putative transposase
MGKIYIHIQRSLTLIKAVNTPVRYTLRGLKNLGITISMDGRGRATDNICIERFWRSAKVERIYLNEYQSISEIITDVDDYIEFYNHRRFHETLDYKKPMDVYQESIKLNQNKKKVS